MAASWEKTEASARRAKAQDTRTAKEPEKAAEYEAQAAEIDKQKALNQQDVAKTEAETKRIQAQGEARANDELNKSLTDKILQQKYIDALSKAKELYVVPDGSTPMVNVGK